MGPIWISLISLLLLSLIGWLGLATIKKSMKKQVGNQLQSTLNANVKSLKIWIEQERSNIDSWVSNDPVKQNILSLIDKTSKRKLSKENLLSSQELHNLRNILGPVCRRHGYVGFVAFDTAGRQIAALLDDPVGENSLVKESDFIQRSLTGETLVSLPFPGETALPSLQGEWKTGQPTMFVSAPVRNDQGGVVGALAFRVRPEIEFMQILEVSRTGHTDETYIFDGEGLMLSDSRFNDRLREMAIIPDRPDSRAILNVHIRNPAKSSSSAKNNTTSGDNPPPLTRMAASAVRGETGTDVHGYSNYCGVPVAGAWTWLPEYNMGIATEMDVKEAFAALIWFKNIFSILFALLVLSAAISLALHARKLRLDQQRQKAEKDLQESETRYREIYHQLSSVVLGTSSATGNEFFQSLVYHIASAFQVQSACIALLTGENNEKGRTLSIWVKDHFIDNFEYSLAGTPCEEVIKRGETYFHPEKIQPSFPEDHYLVAMGIECYLGTPIFNSSGARTGILAVMDNKPRQDLARAQSLLSVFAARAEAEIERQKAEKMLKAAHDTLELQVAQRTTELKTANSELEKEIAERKRIEKNLQIFNDLLNSIRHAQSQYIMETNQSALFSELLGNILSLTQSQFGFIGEILYTPDQKPFLKTHTLTNIGWNDETREIYDKHAITGLEFHRLDTLFGAVITSGKPVLSNHPLTDPRSGGLPPGHPPLHSFLGLPFFNEDTLMGMVGIANREGGYDESFIEYLQPFLTTCSNLIFACNSDKKRREAEDQTKKSLQEKEVLLKELNHRTKNNLQIVSSLLKLQLSDARNKRYDELLWDTHNRIQSMALIHDKIFNSKDLRHINAQDYIFSLTSDLIKSYGKDPKKIVLQVHINNVNLCVRTCSYCGLIINELVSNSLKHAFPRNLPGEIVLRMRRIEDNHLELIVKDNGVGIPEYLDLNNPQTLGLQLVTTLAKDQLEGTLEMSRNYGTEFKIAFPETLT